jgi:NADH-quinone oxidoreductase subunit C
MDEEKKPEGEAPPEIEQPKSEPPAAPVEGAAPAEAKPAEPEKPAPAATPEVAAKPAPPPALQAAAAPEKPAAAKPAAPEKPTATAKPAAKPPPKKAPTEMEVEPWEGPLVESLKRRFGDEIKQFSSYRCQDFLIADAPSVIPILEFLKLEEDFDYLVDITAADYPEKEKRFEVVWILYSFEKNVRVRVKTSVAEGEKPLTACPVHKAADWLEREVFDMFGVEFEGHPNMTRILLPEDWKGYPLRKEYSIIQQDEDWVRENLQIESGQ